MKISILSSRKSKLITLGVVALIALVLVVLELTGTIHLIGSKPIVDKTSKTTSTEPSAQSDFSANNSDKKEPSQSSPQNEALVNDTGGTAAAQQNNSPLVSRDGAISVYAPTNNALFTSGASLSGKSTAPKVSYRLIDDVSGVTATGELTVVNGNFSGKFSFSTNATQGRLDVFRTGGGGVEQSIIEIPVRFR